jgi:O-antigen ligase
MCISLVASIFILRDFRVGAVLLILIMPISASYMFPHELLGITGLNPLNLLIAATLGSLFLRTLVEGKVLELTPAPVLFLYVLPIVVAAVLGSRHIGDIPSIFLAEEMIEFDTPWGYFRDMLLKPLLLVIYALLVAAAVARSRKPESFFVPALLSVWIMGMLVVVFVAISSVKLGVLAQSEARQFFSPLGMHANDLGRLYATAYALLLFSWASVRAPMLKLLLLGSMVVVVVALLLTFSRGAFFGFAVVNLLFIVMRPRLSTIVLLGLLALGALILPGAFYDRFTYGFNMDANTISAGRIELLWKPLLPELERSPLYGQGLGSTMWSDVMRFGSFYVIHPHNAFLEALLDMGAIGLALLLAYFIHVWRGFRKLAKDPRLGALQRGFFEGAGVALIAFMIAGFAGSSLMPVPEQSFLWLAIGMMYGQQRALNAATLSQRGGSTSRKVK